MKVSGTSHKGDFWRVEEARWAVFFDAIGFSYLYKPQGYILNNGQWYHADFWIHLDDFGLSQDTGWGLWCNIAPKRINDDVLKRTVRLAKKSNHNAIIVQGDPGVYDGEYSVTKICVTEHKKPLILNDLKWGVTGCDFNPSLKLGERGLGVNVQLKRKLFGEDLGLILLMNDKGNCSYPLAATFQDKSLAFTTLISAILKARDVRF